MSVSDTLYWPLLKDYHKVLRGLKNAILLIETIEGIGYRQPDLERQLQRRLKRYKNIVKIQEQGDGRE